jgi:putative ABC transport system ATP-binding protein
VNPIISIRGARKVYRMGKERILALDNITLDINKGEVCCLLGTSGSGKSTLLNVTAGLEKPTRGQIIIKGKHLERMNENELATFRQENVGFVFQSYNLLPSLTALENVMLPLIFKRYGMKKRTEIAKKMLASVGLGDRLYHKPNEMSGGQQQRVSIARAFVAEPDIIFADEPTGNLDSKTTKEVLDIMLSMVRKNERTMVMVTHNRDIARHADKVVNILDGNIESIHLNSRPLSKAI